MQEKRITVGLFAVVLLLALTYPRAGPIPAAHAATIVVNTTDDELNSDGNCSLREAIQAANTDTAVDGCTAGSGADTITLPAGFYTLTILGAGENDNATGDLDITSDLTINGEPITVIQAGTNIYNGIDHVLDVHHGTVEMNHLWIEYGRTPGTPGEIDGGGIRHSYGTLTLNSSYVSSNTADWRGGGIYNAGGTLMLNNSTVGYSAAVAGGGIFDQTHAAVTLNTSAVRGNTADYGGGIRNLGTLTLNDSTVDANSAERDGGGICNGQSGTVGLVNSTITDNDADSDHNLTGNGGGIFNSGTGVVELTGSHVADNNATFGGGIYNNGDSTVIMNRSSVADNVCAYSGAGIYNDNPMAILALFTSTINGNDTGLGHGGGIYNGAGYLSLEKCTVSGNSSGESGGGIYTAGSLSLLYTTIANNGSDSDAGGSGDGGGIYVASGTAQTRNTIIGDNSDWDSQAPDCWGTLTLLGHTLLEDSNGCNYSIAGVGNMIDEEPVLGALGDNGGPTWTHALLDGSKAIDSIPDSTSGCQAGVTVDQRGHPRALGVGHGGSACDIGAYEYDSDPFRVFLPLVVKGLEAHF